MCVCSAVFVICVCMIFIEPFRGFDVGIFHAMNHGTGEFAHEKLQRNESLWAAPLKLLCIREADVSRFEVIKKMHQYGAYYSH